MSALFTDDFARADENPLDNGNWDAWGAFAPFDIVDAASYGTVNGGNNASIVTSGSFPDDQYAKIVAGANVNSYLGVMVRCGDGGGYGFQRTPSGGQLFKWSPFGTYNALDSASYSNSEGDTYEVRAIGDAISGWHNGVQVVSATDSEFTSGRPGMYSYSFNDAALSFDAGDFGGASVAPAHYYAQMMGAN